MESPRMFGVVRRSWARTLLTIVALGLAVLVVVFAVVQVRGLIQGVTDRTTGRTVDRSGPVLLQSMRDLSRYDAASGNFQVIVDLEKDAAFLPPAIIGQRTLFVAVGSVDSFVDFSRLGNDAVTVSPDRTSASVRLPHAALDRPNLDHQKSYVFAEERGIVDRLQAFFAQAPNQQAELYQVAERKIGDAAAQSGLVARAEANTRAMLRDVVRALGYRDVTVTYG